MFFLDFLNTIKLRLLLWKFHVEKVNLVQLSDMNLTIFDLVLIIESEGQK